MPEPAVAMDPGRLEAFSDGVFAIAVTLLILEVKVADDGGSLAAQLRHAWPSYVARDRALLKPHVTPEAARAQLRRNLVGFATYVVVTAVAFVAPKVSLAGFGALALFYLLPGRRARE